MLPILLLFGCEDKGVKADSSDSSGLPPRSVTVSWSPSNAKQVAETGGGYLVYIAPVSAALAAATPIQVPNPESGAHVTSTVTQLTPGTYNFAVKAYSSESTSELSIITNFVVPQ